MHQRLPHTAWRPTRFVDLRTERVSAAQLQLGCMHVYGWVHGDGTSSSIYPTTSLQMSLPGGRGRIRRAADTMCGTNVCMQ